MIAKLPLKISEEATGEYDLVDATGKVLCCLDDLELAEWIVNCANSRSADSMSTKLQLADNLEEQKDDDI